MRNRFTIVGIIAFTLLLLFCADSPPIVGPPSPPDTTDCSRPECGNDPAPPDTTDPAPPDTTDPEPPDDPEPAPVISVSNTTVTAEANSRWEHLTIAPAIWANGDDTYTIRVTVRDTEGRPMPGVEVRANTHEFVFVESSQTDSAGQTALELSTLTSTRVFGAPTPGLFVPYDVSVEADGVFLTELSFNAETVVANNPGDGQFFIVPQGKTCVGDPLEIHVQLDRRSDAPGEGHPAGRYVEIRYAYANDRAVIPTDPLGGRTDEEGWIKFTYVPQESNFKSLFAWGDGTPLNISTGFAVEDC